MDTIPNAPCLTCPYRADAAPAVWTAEHYDRLPEYDRETWAQPEKVFGCHLDNGDVCGGWLACHDLPNLLSLRVAVARGEVPPEVFDFTTDVEVMPSGQAARDRGYEPPDHRTTEHINKIVRHQEAKARHGD